MVTYTILGGGIVAGYAARVFAENKDSADPTKLRIVTADVTVPYDRPPLSKDYLEGEENTADVLINDENFYRENGIEVLTGTHITRIDTADRTLHTTNMEIIPFDKLVIATGSKVNTLDIPGADLENVEYLRSLDDSSEIRSKVSENTRAVVLGGGYIGMEVASVLRQLDVPVTMVFPNSRLMEGHFMTPEMSAFFRKYYEERGVAFIPNDKPKRIIGTEGKVSGVELESGKQLNANLVVAGIGVTPVVEMFEGTNLEVDGGLKVDEYLETNIKGIYAAGDVANYYDVIFDKHRQIGHWDNAKAQGEYLAKRLLGIEVGPFIKVPYFFSDIFDLSYEFWGEASSDDQVVYRGDIGADGFSAWWLRDGRVVGAFVMDRPDNEREAAQQWIHHHHHISPEELANADILMETSQA